HVHAVEPELVLARERMPEAAVLGARVGVEALADAVGCLPILLLAHFLCEYDEKIAAEHIVECVQIALNDAVVAYVVVDPALDVGEIRRVESGLRHEILAEGLERGLRAPVAEARGGGVL